MKIKLLLASAISIVISYSSYGDHCPSPDKVSFTFVNDSIVGEYFVINPPEGFSFEAQNSSSIYGIESTEPIVFQQAFARTHSIKSLHNLKTDRIGCIYTIQQKTINSVKLIFSKDTKPKEVALPYPKYDLNENWFPLLLPNFYFATYLCTSKNNNVDDCQFSQVSKNN